MTGSGPRSSRRLVLGLVLAACVVGLGPAASSPAAASPAAASPAAATAPGVGAKTPIQHLIVVIQSGHSFDNYFGTRPGTDGIPKGVCLKVAVGSSSCVAPYHLDANQAKAGLSATIHTTRQAIDSNKMDGFVRAQPNATIGSIAMGHFDRRDLPYYWSLADRFTLLDHFYASSRAGALPNRTVALTGQDAGLESNDPPAQGIGVPSVLLQLDEGRLDWKFYVQGYQGTKTASQSTADVSNVPPLSMPGVMTTPSDVSRIVPTDQYYTDLIKGRLPAVSFVTGIADSERPPEDPALGQSFVRSIVDALMQSREWQHSALLLTYDDAGGWYDHSVPPTVGGQALGLRVPALLVSPYAKAGYVDHGVYDTAAIPGLIDRAFGLPMITPQAGVAGNLLTDVDPHQRPIPAAIEPSLAPVVVRPDVFVIYGMYLAVLAGVGCLVALALRPGLSRRLLDLRPGRGRRAHEAEAPA